MTPSPDDSPTWFQLHVSRPRTRLAVLAVTGELDSSAAAQVALCLRQMSTPDTAQLAIDLTDVTFMGSAGVSVLLAAGRGGNTAPASGHVMEVHLVGAIGNPAVEGVLRILGLDTAFSTFPDLDTCLRHLAETDSTS